MNATRLLLTASFLAAGFLAGVAAAQEQATIAVRIVNASNEGPEGIHPQLADVAKDLKKFRYKSFNLVKTYKKKGVFPESEFRQKLTQVDSIVVQRGPDASGGKIRLTVALVRYDEDEEKEVTRNKVTKAVTKRASFVLMHDQVQVNGKPTILVITYLE